MRNNGNNRRRAGIRALLFSVLLDSMSYIHVVHSVLCGPAVGDMHALIGHKAPKPHTHERATDAATAGIQVL